MHLLVLVTLNTIPYDLYFDDINDVDDEQYDFDAFSSGHSQYLTFSSMVVDLADLVTRDYP